MEDAELTLKVKSVICKLEYFYILCTIHIKAAYLTLWIMGDVELMNNEALLTLKVRSVISKSEYFLMSREVRS